VFAGTARKSKARQEEEGGETRREEEKERERERESVRRGRGRRRISRRGSSNANRPRIDREDKASDRTTGW